MRCCNGTKPRTKICTLQYPICMFAEIEAKRFNYDKRVRSDKKTAYERFQYRFQSCGLKRIKTNGGKLL